WLLLGSLICGLGMANHHILGFAALGLVIWAIWRSPRLLLHGELAIGCVMALLIGLLPYAYMLWAARRNVPVRWGETTTLDSLWAHVSRRQYFGSDPGNDQGVMTIALMVGRLYYALRWWAEQFTPAIILLLIPGLIWLGRRRSFRRWLWMFVLMTACCG